jgi:uncharacterized repeat protein (TIGR01451 family)
LSGIPARICAVRMDVVVNVLPSLSKPDLPVLRRKLAALVSAAALVTLSVAIIGGGGSAQAAPLGFALSPVIETATGLPVCDPLDESPDYADIACNTADNASAYFGSNGTVLGAGFVLETTPVVGTNQAPFDSTTYVVELGVGGVHTASIGIDAKGTNDTDYVYAGCAGAAAPTYTLLLSTALLDGTVTVASDGAYTRVTFNVPISTLATCGITSATTLAPFFGTSQAGPLDNINKDFFLGKSVSFGAVSTPTTPVAPTMTQSTCVRFAPTTPSYVVPTTTGVVYSDGATVLTQGATVPAVAGTTVTVTAAAAPGYVLSPGATTSFPLVFTAAPNCTTSVTGLAPTLVQSTCAGGAPTTPTYTVNAVTGVIYKVAGVVQTGTNNGVAGTTMVLDVVADTANGYVLAGASPTSFNMVFAAAPNCAVPLTPASTVAPTVTQSQCSNGAATTPSYTVPTTTGVVYTPATGGTATPGSTVTVTAAAAPGYILSGPVSFPLVFAAAPACAENVGVSKTGPGSAQPGDELVYSIDVTNVKGTPATGFTVTDVLPTGLSFSAATGTDFTCTNAGQTITCVYGGSLPVGAKATIAVRALLDSTFTGKTVANTAVVDPGRPDSDPADNSSTVTTTVVPLPLTGGGGGTAEAPAPSPSPAATGNGGGAALPFTGSDSARLLQGGVSLLVFGLFLALIARRRRVASE